MSDKQAAYTMVGNAIKSGDMVRPSLCEKCGATCPTIYAHHDDYRRPLDVRWLCPKCHGEFHSEAKPKKRKTKPTFSGKISGFLKCPVCGDPVPQHGTRSKRIYHPECKKVKNYIDATVRAGQKIELLDATTKRTIRGLLFSAAYQFQTPPLRSACGRFVRGDDPPG